MRKIVDYDLQQRDDGVGFRLLFDDHTWTDTSYVIPGMNLEYDCEGFSRAEFEICSFLYDIDKDDFTEEAFIEAIHKEFGISENPYINVSKGGN